MMLCLVLMMFSSFMSHTSSLTKTLQDSSGVVVEVMVVVAGVVVVVGVVLVILVVVVVILVVVVAGTGVVGAGGHGQLLK